MNHIVISVAAPKGGVGKTTTAVNVAVGLALNNKKTLLVDMDPSGYCSSAFGYNEDKIFGKVIDLYKNSKTVHEVIHKTELTHLDLIPFEKIDYENEVLFNGLAANKKVLKVAIDEAKKNYDYIILDCPPFLYGPTINSLLVSDSLIMPVKSSKFSLEAANKMMDFIKDLRKAENKNLKIDGLLLTMYESNTKAAFQVKKELFRLYPNLMFKTAIPKNTSVSESTFYNKPALLFNKNASASKAYLKLVDEIIEKHETSNLMKLSGFDHSDFIDEEVHNQQTSSFSLN
jgi:chromosome partitioning protein